MSHKGGLCAATYGITLDISVDDSIAGFIT